MTHVRPAVRSASATSADDTFDVAAPRARVWTALTSEIGAWWPAALRVGGAGSTVRLDARLDGALIEEWGGGAGQVWMRVHGLVPGSTLTLVGSAPVAHGGPTVTQLHVALADAGSGTRVSVSDTAVHPQRADVARSPTEAWCRHVGDALRRHLGGGR